MKTVIIKGDVWFVDKITCFLYYEDSQELKIKHSGDIEFTYSNFKKEYFEALKFELANLTKA